MSSSLGGVSRRSGLAACACRKGPRVSSGPPRDGRARLPRGAASLDALFLLGRQRVRPPSHGGSKPLRGERGAQMLSTRLGAPRRAPGDGDGPSPRSSAPSAARRPQHFHTGCTAGKSVLSGSRRRPTSQPVRPLQGRPEANPTAARSCDGTAVSTHWLRPRAPYTLLSRQGAPLIPLLTPPPPTLQFDAADQ